MQFLDLVDEPVHTRTRAEADLQGYIDAIKQVVAQPQSGTQGAKAARIKLGTGRGESYQTLRRRFLLALEQTTGKGKVELIFTPPAVGADVMMVGWKALPVQAQETK